MKLDFQTDGGIGTRAKLGVIILEADETLEHEFARLTALPGVVLYHNRIAMVPEIRPETLARMEQELPVSARLLPSLRFDAIGFGCTSAATVIGSANVAMAVQSVCPGAQVTDPLAAIIAAGRHLGVTRLGFVTPYVAEVSAGMRAKLEAAGFEIAGFGSFEEGDDRVVARITEASIVAAIEGVAAQAACDAVVVSCTNLRCLNIIRAAEERTGVPVLTSNQALAWHMLRLAGAGDTNPEFGRLFTCRSGLRWDQMRGRQPGIAAAPAAAMRRQGARLTRPGGAARRNVPRQAPLAPLDRAGPPPQRGAATA